MLILALSTHRHIYKISTQHSNGKLCVSVEELTNRAMCGYEMKSLCKQKLSAAQCIGKTSLSLWKNIVRALSCDECIYGYREITEIVNFISPKFTSSDFPLSSKFIHKVKLWNKFNLHILNYFVALKVSKKFAFHALHHRLKNAIKIY